MNKRILLIEDNEQNRYLVAFLHAGARLGGRRMPRTAQRVGAGRGSATPP
jgi:CheY-like chemotaxis protein